MIECPDCLRGAIVEPTVRGEVLVTDCCIRCGGTGQIDEQAELDDYYRREAERDQAAEMAVERYFEERGWRPDPIEENLWQYDRQTRGW